MPTVAVVDYGMGNLRSVSQAVMHVAAGSGVKVIVTSRPEDVMAAERVVLPGQGAMRDCMRELKDSGLQGAVLHAAAHKPLMGVCVGMQMLLTHSEEQDTPGLDLIPGACAASGWKAGCSPTAAATRCRRWAGTACASAAAPDVGRRARRQLVLLRAQLLRRPGAPAHSAGEHRLR
jgi:hypothetical protein